MKAKVILVCFLIFFSLWKPDSILSGMSFPKENQKCPLVDLALKTMVTVFPLCWGPGLGERDRDTPSGQSMVYH